MEPPDGTHFICFIQKQERKTTDLPLLHLTVREFVPINAFSPLSLFFFIVFSDKAYPELFQRLPLTLT